MILNYGYDKFTAAKLTMLLNEGHLPIQPIELIKNKYNVDIIYDDLEGEEGYTFYDRSRDRYRICIDKNMIESRRRFTEAHEVAHIVLKHFDDSGLISPIEHDELDKHANACASAILMPEHIMLKFNHLSREYISKAFGVSYEALCVRSNYVSVKML